MMMMHNQGFQTIFQKREQFTGYHRLIPPQNIPSLLQGPQLCLFYEFWTLKAKSLKNAQEILENFSTENY